LCMEVLAEVVQSTWPDLKVAEVHDFRQLRGVILENDDDTPVNISLEILQNSGETLEVQAAMSSLSNRNVLYYRSKFLLAKTLPESPLAPSFSPVTPKPIPGRFFYTQYFHGKHWRLLENITSLDRSGVDAVVRVPSMDEWLQTDQTRPTWIIGPGVLDAALQSGFFWLNPVYFALPTRFAKITLYRQGLPEGEKLRMACRTTLETATSILGDVFLMDSQGNVRLKAEGMEMAISKALMRLSIQGPLI